MLEILVGIVIRCNTPVRDEFSRVAAIGAIAYCPKKWCGFNLHHYVVVKAKSPYPAKTSSRGFSNIIKSGNNLCLKYWLLI